MPGLSDDGADSDQRQADVERLAAEWVVRLGGAPLNSSERSNFDAWLAADPAHRAAFEHAQRAWSDLDVLKSQPGRLRSVIAPVRKPASRRSRNVVAGLALLMILGLAALYQVGNPWVALTADFRTAAGEMRTLKLSDGTSVDLGPSSAIAVVFDGEFRRVRLLAGEAYFSVAPRRGAEKRPFVAEAAGGATMALGTQFAVEDRGSIAMVIALEHQIEVSVPGAAGLGRAILSPGDTVQYNAWAGLGAIRKTDAAAATAWRQGMLVFDNTPLSEVVAKLNRYRRGRIVVMNSALAARRVSGVFPSANLDNVVETISGELGARAVSAPPLVTLLY